MTRVAVLDDYGSVARGLGPWERLDGRAEVDFIAEHLDDPAARLAPYDVVVAMRERTAFPRAVLDRLPSLRLLVTTGMMNASIDFDAARDRGVLVCGTGSRGGPTAELTWALVLGLVKHLREEDAAVRAGGWQQSPGGDLEGKRLGVIGLGRLGAASPRSAWRSGWTSSPGARTCRRPTPPRSACSGSSSTSSWPTSDVVTIHQKLSRPHARAARRARAGAHAARMRCSSTRRAARSSTRPRSSTP